MKATTDSSFLYLKLVKSVNFNSVTPEKKNWWNCLSRSAQYNKKFAGKVVNQAKADPDKDKGEQTDSECIMVARLSQL